MSKKLILAAFAALTAFGSAPAFAAPLGDLTRSLGVTTSAAFVSTKSPTLAPFAQIRFCVQNPDDCQGGSASSIVSLDSAKSAELMRINRSVNAGIRPVNDKNGALGDIWQANVTSGDCEDFALTKRRQLISLGWPVGALRIAVARTRQGEGHAVLVVKTSKGDLVLDNRTSKVRTWNRTNLTWIKIQSGENPRLWFSL